MKCGVGECSVVVQVWSNRCGEGKCWSAGLTQAYVDTGLDIPAVCEVVLTVVGQVRWAGGLTGHDPGLSWNGTQEWKSGGNQAGIRNWDLAGINNGNRERVGTGNYTGIREGNLMKILE